MTNYFGKSRLIKILYAYISDRPEIVKSFRTDVKKFGKEMIFQYRRYRGSEWLDCWSDEYRFHFFTFGAYYKTVCLDEEKYNEASDEYVKSCRIVSYYSKNFYPYPENKNKQLDCYEIAKPTSADAETETVFVTEDGKHYCFEKIRDNGNYEESANCSAIKILIPKDFFIRIGSAGHKRLYRKADGQDGYILKNPIGKPYIYCGKHGEYSEALTVVN